MARADRAAAAGKVAAAEGVVAAEVAVAEVAVAEVAVAADVDVGRPDESLEIVCK